MNGSSGRDGSALVALRPTPWSEGKVRHKASPSFQVSGTRLQKACRILAQSLYNLTCFWGIGGSLLVKVFVCCSGGAQVQKSYLQSFQELRRCRECRK